MQDFKNSIETFKNDVKKFNDVKGAENEDYIKKLTEL